MNGNNFLLDTNMALACLRGMPGAARLILGNPGTDLHVSVITRMELLAFDGLTPDMEAAVHRLLDDMIVVPLNPGVERIAIALRRETKRKLPDSIVAASAVWLGVPLVTGDKQLSKTTFKGLETIYVPMTQDESPEPP